LPLCSRYTAGACPFRHPQESPPSQGRPFRSGLSVKTPGARTLGGGRYVALPPSIFLPAFAPAPPGVLLSTQEREPGEKATPSKTKQLAKKRGEKEKERKKTERCFVALGLVPDGEHSVLKGTQREKNKQKKPSRCSQLWEGLGRSWFVTTCFLGPWDVCLS